MKSDPIVDEVRKVREAHAAKFNYRFVGDLCRSEEERKGFQSPGRISSTEVATEIYRKLTIGLRRTRRTVPLTQNVSAPASLKPHDIWL